MAMLLPLLLVVVALVVGLDCAGVAAGGAFSREADRLATDQRKFG